VVTTVVAALAALPGAAKARTYDDSKCNPPLGLNGGRVPAGFGFSGYVCTELDDLQTAVPRVVGGPVQRRSPIVGLSPMPARHDHL
jgi:hypothetical protein